jgi:hypothetical protein
MSASGRKMNPMQLAAHILEEAEEAEEAVSELPTK